MPEDRDLVQERGSILYGRPTTSYLKGNSAPSTGGNSAFSCLDGCYAAIASLLMFPQEDAPGSDAHGNKAIAVLPRARPWADVPEDRKGTLRIHVNSAGKEGVDCWVNQDSALACCPHGCGVQEDGSGPFYVFGVFDGHGRKGHEVSKLAAERLPGHLSSQQEHPAINPAAALKAAMMSTDKDIYKALHADVEFSGSTAAVVLFDQSSRQLTIANVGDSRVVLGQLCSDAKEPRWHAVPLTVDLKPDLPEERERIDFSGGHVAKWQEHGQDVGPMRVWDSRALDKPGLACSRSLGDGCARSLGVTQVPVVTSYKLQPEDRFILIATDGLWDSVDNMQAVSTAGKFLHMPEVATKALLEAVRRQEEAHLVDDTSIVLVAF